MNKRRLQKKKGLNFKQLMNRLSRPQYRGKHVIAIGSKIFAVRTGREASAILDRLARKYPQDSPTITYVPKADSLILILR